MAMVVYKEKKVYQACQANQDDKVCLIGAHQITHYFSQILGLPGLPGTKGNAGFPGRPGVKGIQGESGT